MKEIDEKLDLGGIRFTDLNTDDFEESAKFIYRVFEIYKAAQLKDLAALRSKLIHVDVPKPITRRAKLPKQLSYFLDPYITKTAFYTRDEEPFSVWSSYHGDKIEEVKVDKYQKIYYICRRRIPVFKCKRRVHRFKGKVIEEELCFPEKFFNPDLLKDYEDDEKLPGLAMKEIDEWKSMVANRAKHTFNQGEPVRKGEAFS